MRIEVVQSPQALQQVAPAWNELWEASDLTLPTCKAETLALWLEQFAPSERLAILLAWQGDRLAAALPVLGGRLKGIVPCGKLPVCPWGASGDLLLSQSPHVDGYAALHALIDGLERLSWPVCWWEGVRYEEPRWRLFLRAARDRGLGAFVQPQWRNGMIDVDHDWSEYRARWSRNHRRAMRRASERAAESGNSELRVVSSASPAEVEASIRRGFAVEDKSWKGAAGTSVLRSPGMLDYYCRQARLLAAWGELDLAFLEVGGQPIAFEYAPRGKGIYHAAKVGYDETHEQLSPGQLLRYKLFERMFVERTHAGVDFAGILVESTAKWSTRAVSVGRLILAQRSPAGRLFAAGYARAYPRWRQFKARKQPEPSPIEPGATRREGVPCEV